MGINPLEISQYSFYAVLPISHSSSSQTASRCQHFGCPRRGSALDYQKSIVYILEERASLQAERPAPADARFVTLESYNFAELNFFICKMKMIIPKSLSFGEH